MTLKPSWKIHASARLALVYLAFSVLWILVSDEFVAQVANRDPQIAQKLQNTKGLAFVLFSGILLYVTARKIYRSLQDTLSKKEELLDKLDALSEAAGEGIVDYNLETDTAIINDEMKLLLAIDQSTVPNFSAIHNKLIHPDDRSRIAERFKEFLQSHHHVWQWEYRYANTDGSYRDIISRGYVIRDKITQKPLNVIYTLQDVTEIRNTKAKYYKQQMLFRQSLSKTMIEAEEKERNRWAQELHDNVCQVLTVAKLYHEQALMDSAENPFLKKSKTMIEKAINDIRNISSNIKPPEFDVTTLYEAINCLVENIKRFVIFNFTIEYDQQADKILSAEQKLMVYRVIQEQLNNIMKYSEATNVWLHIAVHDNRISIRIKDDGKGFDPQKVKTGIGLKNINSRLQVFSGSLDIHSAPGDGCELKAHFSIA
jgi:two-component system sensor histidine kinase UhpB